MGSQYPLLLSAAFLAALSPALAQTPAAPANLTVVSATSKQVKLSWSPSSGAKSYAVERKSEGGSYGTVLTVTQAAAMDDTIDPYTTYTYRVTALNDTLVSSPSNEVVAGPPPYGFNVVVPKPDSWEDPNAFGTVVRMALDSNGDPSLAWVNVDPNADGDYSDSILYFISWNRALYKWNDPVAVKTVGAVEMHRPMIPISLARDAGTNLWGLAYQVVSGDASLLELATSADNGSTWKACWTAGGTVEQPAEPVFEPSLAMAGGKIHLAWYVNGGTLRYVTGKTDEDTANWKTQDVPLPGGYTSAAATVSVAVDSNGDAGIAFMALSDSNSAAAFWRSAAGGASVVIAGGNGFISDAPDISLSFYGTEPRVAMDAVRDDQYNSAWDHTVWAARANGDGNGSWSVPVNIPSDGEYTIEGPVSMASGSQGQVAIAMSTNGGIGGTSAWGYPKLARSADFISFQTVAPAPAGNPAYGQVGWPVVVFGGNDKLWSAFQNNDILGELGVGLILWREQ